MLSVSFFHPGERVKIKTGLFAGKEGKIIDSFSPGLPEKPWNYSLLTVQTKAFDGSKVIVHLNSDDVEILGASDD